MVLPLQFLLPVILGLVLVVSGVLKVKSPGATLDAIRAFRLPVLFQARWMTYALPAIEIILGVGLLIASGWLLKVIGALAAALFVLFTVFVASVLWREEIVSCSCFGSMSAEPIRWPMLVRNLLLSTAALMLTLGLDGSLGALDALLTFSTGDYVWLLGVATLVSWRTAARWLSHNEEAGGSQEAMLPDSLVIDLSGQGIPELEFRDSEQQVVKLPDLPRERAQLLLFARPGCETCGPIMASLPIWRKELGPTVEVRVVTTHSHSDLAAAYPSEGKSALHDGSSMGATILGIPGVPSALLLGTNGQIGAGPAVGPDAVTGLMESVIEAVKS
ncbi:hypothetical protein ART_4034 [Arthrobacter sp. PAMC 25486]|uniref:MauE/DoxX family redox-associated membrane protein n=1 Tax=Arthrobacter sp. PAMC 25486 TaxID=1494608 RepID=UPI00053623BC|nr:MauE/DoxX family redox-associated membrane protein [Arthrobacter sp. PAMC 25486]AIY03633.1 hypothetical protein ART_4034 [Arthrobacter sp. PAMC 25486]